FLSTHGLDDRKEPIMNATPGCPDPPEPHINSEWIEVRGRRYPLRELRHVRIMHAPHSDLTSIATLASLAIIIGIARLWDRLDTTGMVGALPVLAVPAVLLLIGILSKRPSRVLVAEFRGEVVLIADDRDRRRFRAIMRATQLR